MTVVTTAPSYLFWRCAPPELRVPQQILGALEPHWGTKIAVGPHGSTKLLGRLAQARVDAVVLGECEETLVRLADLPRDRWDEIAGLCYDGSMAKSLSRAALRPPIWRTYRRSLAGRDHCGHRHHHHRFDATPIGPGAEMEASRGCPIPLHFCAKENFRDKYRRRPLDTILAELDGLIAAGVTYVYFIDEIFLPWRQLLEAVATRPVQFGVQTRIDLWNRDDARSPWRRRLRLDRGGCREFDRDRTRLARQNIASSLPKP